MDRYENLKKFHTRDRVPNGKKYSNVLYHDISNASSQYRSQVTSEMTKIIKKVNQDKTILNELSYIMPIMEKTSETWWDCYGGRRPKIY
jgi:hypothetical protein